MSFMLGLPAASINRWYDGGEEDDVTYVRQHFRPLPARSRRRELGVVNGTRTVRRIGHRRIANGLTTYQRVMNAKDRLSSSPMAASRTTVSAEMIAKLVGVSTASVSRVIHGMPGVSAQTIARVNQVIKEKNFKPQRVHRKRSVAVLSRKTKGSVAIVTLLIDPTDLVKVPAYSAVLSGIKRGAQQAGVELVRCTADRAGNFSSKDADGKICGAIVFVSGILSTAALESFFRSVQKRMPVVWVMGAEGIPSPSDHVIPDNMGVGHLACRHLYDAGCKTLAYLAINPFWPFVRLRGHGFIDSAFDLGLKTTAFLRTDDARYKDLFGPRTVVEPTLPELVRRLIAMPKRPEGLFIATDEMAASVYPLLVAAGVRIGDDIRVVSCDNASVHLAKMKPRPATIDLGSQEIGYRAFFRLLNRLERPGGPPLIIQVAPRLCPASPL